MDDLDGWGDGSFDAETLLSQAPAIQAWVDNTVQEEGGTGDQFDGKRTVFYTLNQGGIVSRKNESLYKQTARKQLVELYCNEKSIYYQFSPKDMARFVFTGQVYISKDFFDLAKLGQVPWSNLRLSDNPPKTDTAQDPKQHKKFKTDDSSEKKIGSQKKGGKSKEKSGRVDSEELDGLEGLERIGGVLQWKELVMAANKVQGKTGNRAIARALRGGFLIPARNENGDGDIYEIPKSVLDFADPGFWEMSLSRSQTQYSSKNITAMRAWNPDEGTTFYIKPQKRWEKLVKKAFDWLETNKRIVATYLVVKHNTKLKEPSYVKLYGNPLNMYETYIDSADWDKYMDIHPDREIPEDFKPLKDLVMAPTKKEAEEMDRVVFGGKRTVQHPVKTGKKTPGKKAGGKKEPAEETKGKERGAYHRFDGVDSICQINADKIRKAVGKRSGVASQKTVMKVSAVKIASEYFNWNKKDRPSPPHIAEWLHISAFAYGGISDDEMDAYASSQSQLNMIIGTSETNSVMLRVEKAWQDLFIHEQDIRKAYEDALKQWKNLFQGYRPNLDTPSGTLTTRCNASLDVCSWKRLNGHWTEEYVSFDEDKGWTKAFEDYPWICLVMQYNIQMDSYSILLDQERPKYVTEFYPFTRMPFTLGEGHVDTWLIKELYNERLAALKEAIQVEMDRLEKEKAEKKKKGRRNQTYSLKMRAVSNPMDRLQLNNDDALNNEALMASEGTNLATTDISELTKGDLEPFTNEPPSSSDPFDNFLKQEETISHGDDRSAEVITNENEPSPQHLPSMAELESELTQAVEINVIDSIDTLLDLENFDFRGTLEEGPQAAGVAAAAMSEFSAAENVPKEESSIAPTFKIANQVSSKSLSESHADSNEQPDVASIPVAAADSTATLVVGGIALSDVKLVLGKAESQDFPAELSYADMSVSVRAAEVQEHQEAVLIMPAARPKPSSCNWPEIAPPILVLSSLNTPDMALHGTASTVTEIQQEAVDNFGKAGAAMLSSFMLSGETSSLFGIPYLPAKIFSLSDSSQPTYEEAVPNLANLSGSAFGVLLQNVDNSILQAIPVENLKFVYSENKLDMFHRPGLRLEAYIQFTGSLQMVADVLKSLCGENDIPPKGLHVSAHLDTERNWADPPDFTSLILQGTFKDFAFRIGDVFVFSTIGMEVSTHKSSLLGDRPGYWNFGFGFFGQLRIENIPMFSGLEVKYRMSKFGGRYDLQMSLASPSWTNVFGIKQLTLQNVLLSTSFDTKSFKDSLTIQISAVMALKNTSIYVSGQYSKAESYLEAEIGDLSLLGLQQIYADIFGEEIPGEVEDEDIMFEELYLQMSTDGFEFMGRVLFNECSSAEGRVAIDSRGIEISGAIGDYKVPDHDITIKSASLDIFLAVKSKDASTPIASRISIKGEVEFEGNRVEAMFYLSSDPETGKRIWMLYGAFKGDMPLSRLNDGFKGGTMDLTLRDAAIIASNMDEKTARSLGTAQGANNLGYPVTTGLQLCARLDPIIEINNLNPKAQKVDGLVLVAAIASGKLALMIKLPSSMRIRLSESTSFYDFAVSLEVSKSPLLSLEGKLAIMMKGQDPLILETILSVNTLGAGCSVVSRSPWKNPLGVSDRLVIEKLGVDAAILWSTVWATGPSKLALSGKIALGAFNAGMALSVSQRPDQQLLIFDISKINIVQLVRFAGKLADSETLQTCDMGGEIVFSDANMYCSTGASIGKDEYPPGLSASGAISLYGKTARFKADIGKNGVVFDGSVSNFEIGPLRVQSASGGPDARLAICMTPQQQSIKIDGSVELYGTLKLAMLVDISVKPLVFNVNITVELTQALKFKLIAVAKDIDPSGKSLSNATLIFEAELDGDVLKVICDAVLAILSAIKDLGLQLLDGTTSSIEARLQELEANVRIATQAVDNARVEIQAEQTRRGKEQSKWESARQKAADELARLEKELENKQADSSSLKEKIAVLSGQVDQMDGAYLQRKRQEYNTQREQADKQYQDHLREERRLQAEMKERYGPIQFRCEELNRDLTLKETVRYQLTKKIEIAERELREANVFTKVPRALALGTLYATRTTIDVWLEGWRRAWNATNSLLESVHFKSLDQSMKDIANSVSHAADALKGLQKGFDEFLRIAKEDRDEKLLSAIRELRVAQDNWVKVDEALKKAEKILKDAKPGLNKKIGEAMENVQRVKADGRLAVLEERLASKKREKEAAEQQLRSLKESLEGMRKQFSIAMDDLTGAVKQLSAAMFHITKIKVKANSKELAQGGPLVFRVESERGGKPCKPLEIHWAPIQKPQELYKSIAKNLLGI